MLVVSHPSGNANVRQVLAALEGDGLLAEFVTFFATVHGNTFDKLSRLPGGAEFERRRLPASFANKLAQKPWPELLRLAAERFRVRPLLQHQAGFVSPDRNNVRLSEFAAGRLRALTPRSKGVYCYEDAALETFEAASLMGVRKIYDQPIGYWRAARRILKEEAERRPEWAPTMPGLQDSEEKLARKDRELELADLVMVASSFTRDTLKEAPFKIAPVEVAPYGADDAILDCAQDFAISSGGPLRVLFVGSLTQRKGIADLFDAVDLLGKHVELTLIGTKPQQECKALERSLKKHRWLRSASKSEVLAEMALSDIFVFPSLFEGFGLVITEALSQGLPVITTPNTCGPDVLTEGEDGFIVPIRDPQAIAEKLELLHRDRGRLAAMSEAARKKAESLTWESYRKRVVEVVREVLGEGR